MVAQVSFFIITTASMLKFSKQLHQHYNKRGKNLYKTYTFGTTSVVKPFIKRSEIVHSVIHRSTTEICVYTILVYQITIDKHRIVYICTRTGDCTL